MIHTLKLTPSTLPDFIKALHDHTPVVILYHMNGCFHCNAMMPSWQAAKKNVQKLKGTVLVADVEYSNMYLLPRGMQGINGFPTIKAFTNKIIEYPGVNSGISGDRSTDSFVAFISKYMIKPKPNPKSKPKEKVA